MSEEELRIPERFRELHISSLNYSVHMRTTYENEDLNYLITKAMIILDSLVKVEKNGD